MIGGVFWCGFWFDGVFFVMLELVLLLVLLFGLIFCFGVLVYSLVSL